jgi:glycosyltransferase involved in cell wall biosynthesis
MASHHDPSTRVVRLNQQTLAGRQRFTSRTVARAIYHSARQTANRYRYPPLKIPVTTRSVGSTVFMLCPDYDIPSGGIRVQYRHVDLLNEAGIDATILHQRRGFRCSWFDNTTRVTDIRSAAVGPDDILVLSELDLNQLARLNQHVRHIVLNQNTHLTWRRDSEIVAHHYAEAPDLLGVIVVSEHNAQMLRYAYPHRMIRSVRNGINNALFHPGDQPPQRRITYAPRRGQQEITQVLYLLRDRLQGWDVVALDGLHQTEFAAGLRSSRITLCLSYQEGFGLPAAEAMACGNYVIGFHGFGGREFMRPEFSCPVETGDVLAVAEAVEHAIAQDSADENWCISRGKLASAFVLDAYSRERELESVRAAYAELLAIG